MWLIGLIFEHRIGLVFQYTQLQLRSWCTNYICILNIYFYTTYVQKKVHLSEDINNLWLISNFYRKNVVFPYFSWFFAVITTDFCQISQNAILRCKLWTVSSFCTQKVFLYWFSVKFLWLKDVFFNYKIGRHISTWKPLWSICKYLRGTRQLLITALVWTTILVSYILLRTMVWLIIKTFFSFCSFYDM